MYAQGKKQRHFHVTTLRALHQMQLIAIKSLSKVLLANPSFNCSDVLIKALVAAGDLQQVMDGAVSTVAVQTVVRVFEQRSELEQISELVLEIGRYVKVKNNKKKKNKK